MIVFWRLFLAVFLTDFLLFDKTLHTAKGAQRFRAVALRSLGVLVLSLLFCYKYVTTPWPFLHPTFLLPGWVCIVGLALFHALTDVYFHFGGRMKGGYTLTFVLRNLVNVWFMVLIAPFRTLYETGAFFAEPWVVFCGGLVIATRVIGAFIFALEQDLYGRDYPTFDEQWMLALMRAIFFLSMLLPGIRWAVVLVAWLGACVYARRIRLLDVPVWAFWMCVIGASFVGFLLRLRFYLVN